MTNDLTFQAIESEDADPDDLVFQCTMTMSPREVAERLPLWCLVERCMFLAPVAFMEEVIKDACAAPDPSGEVNFPRADARRMLELVDAFRAALENAASIGFERIDEP